MRSVRKRKKGKKKKKKKKRRRRRRKRRRMKRGKEGQYSRNHSTLAQIFVEIQCVGLIIFVRLITTEMYSHLDIVVCRCFNVSATLAVRKCETEVEYCC